MFSELVARAGADAEVRGLYVHGSRAFEGMATEHSDYDVCVLTDQGDDERWHGGKSAGIDLHVTTLHEVRAGLIDGEEEWRYILAHADVIIDRGGLADLVREAATFPLRSIERRPAMLDAYANLHYRSVKNHRDGRHVEAHFDAAESIRLVLSVIFAMHERLRPPNKYLLWELQRHPLGDGWLEASHLVPRLQRIVAEADPHLSRELFQDVELLARAVGHGDTIDAWGTDLELMRPT